MESGNQWAIGLKLCDVVKNVEEVSRQIHRAEPFTLDDEVFWADIASIANRIRASLNEIEGRAQQEAGRLREARLCNDDGNPRHGLRILPPPLPGGPAS